MYHNSVTPFSWENLTLCEAIDLNGVPHVTRRAMGEWLEYANPQTSVDTIIKRNPHIENHSVAISLMATDGKQYDTSVYHPIGFLLTVMASDQPKAKAMQEAVAKFVWHFSQQSGRIQEMTTAQRIQMRNQLFRAIDRYRKTRNAFVRSEMALIIQDLHEGLGLASPQLEMINTLFTVSIDGQVTYQRTDPPYDDDDKETLQ
ncbi:hypothetical protein [Magnetofaba australis]|uniref:Putative prophage Sa05, BRO domain protein n=1 Tax=Magnetofaba australis IT-1 TaxID=1434232 RepID=A0A1Y2KA17_9PROT|nr:hypothetical protein [Magnetofaba australis]OSM06754.1 putative prophage Sa05, BRO domain protein [Magnetofaba australis IT-1]